MVFSFTINGNPSNSFNDINNPHQMEYVKRYGYPRTCIDRLKMKEYEKAMKEIVIIEDVEIVDPSKEKEIVEEKNIDISSEKSEEITLNHISGNQV